LIEAVSYESVRIKIQRDVQGSFARNMANRLSSTFREKKENLLPGTVDLGTPSRSCSRFPLATKRKEKIENAVAHKKREKKCRCAKSFKTPFSHRFFHLYLVYFNSTEFVLKLAVEGEDIAVINISSLTEEKNSS